jgi:hypothetical protein
VTLSIAASRSIWPASFAQLNGGPVRTWAPCESPFRIEYAPDLLREIRIAKGGVDAFGMLYGLRHGQTIRLVSTRGRAGLDPLGIFAARVRGQVFLTEEDMGRFEKADACVALVTSGETGGFFVRDSAGSIEAVRSYEEFSIYSPVKVVKQRWSWTWCLALLPLLYLIPRHPPPPLAVTLREDSGQLRISWNVPVKTTLSILDGSQRTSISIARDLSSLTYERGSGDVTVEMGSAQARFVGARVPPKEIEQERADLEALTSKIAALRAVGVAGEVRIAELERRLQ